MYRSIGSPASRGAVSGDTRPAVGGASVLRRSVDARRDYGAFRTRRRPGGIFRLSRERDFYRLKAMRMTTNEERVGNGVQEITQARLNRLTMDLLGLLTIGFFNIVIGSGALDS